LPWEDVQRLLRAVDTSTAGGVRDHALLLMMSTSGLGAGEAIALQLQDIDWNACTSSSTRDLDRYPRGCPRERGYVGLRGRLPISGWQVVDWFTGVVIGAFVIHEGIEIWRDVDEGDP
jgi:integrase